MTDENFYYLLLFLEIEGYEEGSIAKGICPLEYHLLSPNKFEVQYHDLSQRVVIAST